MQRRHFSLSLAAVALLAFAGTAKADRKVKSGDFVQVDQTTLTQTNNGNKLKRVTIDGKETDHMSLTGSLEDANKVAENAKYKLDSKGWELTNKSNSYYRHNAYYNNDYGYTYWYWQPRYVYYTYTTYYTYSYVYYYYPATYYYTYNYPCYYYTL